MPKKKGYEESNRVSGIHPQADGAAMMMMMMLNT